ncbi:MAG TPA: guanylate kinase [Bryobacteraceae bacterium]|jgi:guanylate kinase|nr:guanylate kinase [Bryobacteraceae bacterium]
MSIVFIISAPSGSGKSTLVQRLLKTVPGLTFSISYTTRPPRGQEKDGESYHFISREDFEACISRGEFLEHADVFGNYYGTHRRVLDEANERGLDLVLDIDVQGAGQLKRQIPDAVSIFILAPSRGVLEKRLRDRSEDSDAVIERRLRDAAREIRNYCQYDYVLINNDLQTSAESLAGIVRAERTKRSRMEGQIRPILATFE